MTNSIKFYWNGIKFNGEKSLIKCFYSLDNNPDHAPSVTIYADSYSHCLPSDMFPVENDTDLYTDYFDDDRATITPEHPLYKYARFAAVKAQIRDCKLFITHTKKRMERVHEKYRALYQEEIDNREARIAALEQIEDPGQPTEEDVAAVHAMNLAAENARKAAQQEAEQKEREKMIACKNAGRIFIEETARKFPIREGEPVVTINWSENPAFYSWEYNELKLSVAAAEIVLKTFDEKVHAEGDRGYDKTKFTIHFVNEDGEEDSYGGRYDLGDNDGGMIEHIRSWGRFLCEKGSFGNGNVSDEDRAQGEAILRFAEMLGGYAA